MSGTRRFAIAALAIAATLAASTTGCATPPAPGRDNIPATVRDFLDDKGWDLDTYADSDLSDPGRYFRHERHYSVDAPADELWALYVSVDPRRAWDTGMTRFGVVWDPLSGRLYGAADEPVPPFAEGQVYALELRLAGFYRIPVAFRITKIDGASFSIEFVYLEENKSNGVQRIGFSPAVDESGRLHTRIDHLTWYRSDGGFRDRGLYGRFHGAIIDDFHRGIVGAGGYAISVLE